MDNRGDGTLVIYGKEVPWREGRTKQPTVEGVSTIFVLRGQLGPWLEELAARCVPAKGSGAKGSVQRLEILDAAQQVLKGRPWAANIPVVVASEGMRSLRYLRIKNSGIGGHALHAHELPIPKLHGTAGPGAELLKPPPQLEELVIENTLRGYGEKEEFELKALLQICANASRLLLRQRYGVSVDTLSAIKSFTRLETLELDLVAADCVKALIAAGPTVRNVALLNRDAAFVSKLNEVASYLKTLSRSTTDRLVLEFTVPSLSWPSPGPLIEVFRPSNVTIRVGVTSRIASTVSREKADAYARTIAIEGCRVTVDVFEVLPVPSDGMLFTHDTSDSTMNASGSAWRLVCTGVAQ